MILKMDVLNVEFLRNTSLKAMHRYRDMESGGNDHVQREEFGGGSRCL